MNNFSDPAGIGFAAIGNDLLPTIILPGANSLTPFLGASSLTTRSYAGQLNETGVASDYTLNFIASPIPELSCALLLGLTLLSSIILRIRR